MSVNDSNRHQRPDLHRLHQPRSRNNPIIAAYQQRQGIVVPQHQQQQEEEGLASSISTPVMVEDIPCVELYSEIVGTFIQPSKRKGMKRISPNTSENDAQGNTSQAPVVADDDDGDEQQSYTMDLRITDKAGASDDDESEETINTGATKATATSQRKRKRRVMDFSTLFAQAITTLEQQRQQEKDRCSKSTKGVPASSRLALDQRNKGFQLLARMGWKEQDGGLGKDRQGKLEPIQPLWKQNKRGLGASIEKRKINHETTVNRIKGNHGGHSISQRKLTKGAKRKRRRAQQEAEQEERKRIRRMLQSDVLDEDDALYASLISSRPKNP